jgi:transposase InsO family protein
VVHGKASRQTDNPRPARATHRTFSEAFKREAVSKVLCHVLDYIAAWCNTRRLHSTLDYQSPAAYERHLTTAA